VFCSKCSDRNVILPHIGMETEVRVCETCNDKFASKSAAPSPELERRVMQVL